MIGAGAYVGYQLGKATGRFGGWHHGGGWGWNDYNRWRQEDGMLCRNNQDCTWMDPSMHCEDYELDFNINRGWYGGDYLAVVGECECDTWSRWDNWELRCEFSFFASKQSHIVSHCKKKSPQNITKKGIFPKNSLSFLENPEKKILIFPTAL